MTTPTLINNRWTLNLPHHRAVRPQWPWWERERLAAMCDRITPGDVVFDIGAEEGDLSALWALWGARVVLFEPNPLVWPNIRTIWEANRLPAPLGWFVGFASNRTRLQPDEVEPVFTEPEIDGWPACAYGPVIGDHGFRNVAERWHDTPQVTLDYFVTQSDIIPDVITIDVEGAELEVLKGTEHVLRTAAPTVFVSIHPEFMRAMYKQSDSGLHDFMRTLGYEGTHLATDHEIHYQFEPA